MFRVPAKSLKSMEIDFAFLCPGKVWKIEVLSGAVAVVRKNKSIFSEQNLAKAALFCELC